MQEQAARATAVEAERRGVKSTELEKRGNDSDQAAGLNSLRRRGNGWYGWRKKEKEGGIGVHSLSGLDLMDSRYTTAIMSWVEFEHAALLCLVWFCGASVRAVCCRCVRVPPMQLLLGTFSVWFHRPMLQVPVG